VSWRERLTLAVLPALLAGGCARPLGEAFLPKSLHGWDRVGAVRHYTPENLYDYINGAAPFICSFGFRSLAQATYRREADQVVLDIYDMGSADNAFALFRNQSSVEAAPLDVGAEGAGSEARVEFWQGCFYVAASCAAPEAHDRVAALARALARGLPPTGAWPAYLGLLPTEGRLPRTESYAPADFLGHECLKRAVSARYKLGGREAMAFACRYDGAAEAAAALARLEAHYRQKQAPRPLALGDGGFVADDPTQGQLAAFRRGALLGGMTRYGDDPAAKALLADLDRRLAPR